MPPSKRQKIIDSAIKTLLDDYGIVAKFSDIFVFDKPFLSTVKTAELFSTSYHNFSHIYVKSLLSAGVQRIISGRNKFYDIEKIIHIRQDSGLRGISVFDVCREMKNKLAKKRSK